MTFMRHFHIAVALGVIMNMPAAAQDLLPRWEVTALAEGLVEHSKQIEDLLLRVRPKEWIQDGAPQAFVTQHEELIQDIANLSLSAQNVHRNPEKLSAVVDTYLWLDRLDSMIASIANGARKYQNPAVADWLIAAKDRNMGQSEGLKTYLRQLVMASEAEMEIAHSEAQRCRGDLASRPRGRD